MPKRLRKEKERESEFCVKRETEEVAIKAEEEDIGLLGTESPSHSNDEEQAGKRLKSSAAQTNDDGDTYFVIAKKKRVTVRQWKGLSLVDIREYYKNEGDVERPTKKGISLTVEQFRNLLKYADEINDILDSME